MNSGQRVLQRLSFAGLGCTTLAVGRERRWVRCVATSHSPPAESPKPFIGWVVADMDGTLVGKPGFRDGRYVAPKLDTSPCFAPVCRWLQVGGGLLVVTSDDGDGPINRILKPIPSELRQRVLLCTGDGAALFRVAQDGEVRRLVEYDDGHLLPAKRDYLEKVYDIARDMYISFLKRLAANPTILASLDEESRSTYTLILERVRTSELTLEELLTVNNLLKPACFRRRGTLLWRPQSGPRSQWSQCGSGSDFEQLCSRDLVAEFASIILLCIPAHLSEPHCEEVKPRLEQLGLVASRAPSSVWLKPVGTHKGLPIHWLRDEANGKSHCFKLQDAVAFGDNPCGNDAPLTEFDSLGMPFVSVGSMGEWSGFEIGGFELGTACALEHLLQVLIEDAGAAQQEGREPLRLGELSIFNAESKLALLQEVHRRQHVSTEVPEARL